MKDKNIGAVLPNVEKDDSKCEFEDNENKDASSADMQIDNSENRMETSPVNLSGLPDVNEAEDEAADKKDPSKIKVINSTKKSTLSSVIRVVICVFLTLVLLVLSVVTNLVLTVRQVLDNDKLAGIPAKLDPVKIMEELNINTIDDGDKGDVRKTYRRLDVTKYMGYALKRLGSDILDGKSFQGVDTEDIYRNIEPQLDFIKEETGYEIDREELKTFLDSKFGNFFQSISGKVAKVAKIYEAIGIVCSVWNIILLVLIQLGIMTLIFMINRWRLRSMFWISSAIMLGAVLYTIELGLLGTSFISSYLPSNEILYDVVEILFGFMFWNIINIGVITFACGLIMLAATLVSMKIIKSKKQRIAQSN